MDGNIQHVTQFTQPGWHYLKAGSGSGVLPMGGYYVTFVNPASEDFTINVVKIDHDHAPCTRPGLPNLSVSAENVSFQVSRFFLCV